MLIKCINNESSNISNWNRDNRTPLNEILELGKLYIVYGVCFLENEVFFEIITYNDSHTSSYPSALFDIIDSRISRLFVLGKIIMGDDKTIPFLSFREWADDPEYFGKLVDGDKQAELIFENIKELMALEYRHPHITQRAIAIEEKWVQCATCAEAWPLIHPDYEMCQCPSCKTVMLTPHN